MRHEGFYWVKEKGEWVVAEWKNNNHKDFWFTPNSCFGKYDNDLEQINENRILSPDENTAKGGRNR